MLKLYGWLTAVLVALCAPLHRFTLGARPGSPPRKERLGFVERVPAGGIWFHSVSLGEASVAAALIARLRGMGINGLILWTATTPAGLEAAAAAAARFPDVRVQPFPVDTRAAVRRFLECTSPRALILVETEIWPILLDELNQRSVPVLVVNGRISDGATKRLALAGCSNLLTRLAQVAHGRWKRFVDLGAQAEAVSAGDVKWDRRLQDNDQASAAS